MSGPASQAVEHICLIDGSNMLHRAAAMAKPRSRQTDGMEVGATWLFSQMITKLLRRMGEGRMPPQAVAIFFDPSREASWRRAVFPAYKANRPPSDPLLTAQIPLMQTFCRDMGLGVATAPEHEADDLVAAYAEDAVRDGMRVSIVSNDKDLMQLVRPRVMQVNTMTWTWYNEAAVEEKFGVPPRLVGDYLALAGDAADGVPGAPGIGPKAAVALLGQFGSLSAMLTRSGEIERASWRRIIEENKEILRLSRMLVALDAAGAPRPLCYEEMRALSGDRAAARAAAWRDDNLA